MFFLISFRSFSQDIPDWFLNPPDDINYLYIAKTATSNVKQAALDNAKNEAKLEVCKIIESRFLALKRRFDEEINLSGNSELMKTFTQTIENVISESHNNCKVEKKHVEKDGNNWRAYVLVSYPVEAANRAFVNQIKQQQKIYSKFKASQTFEELEKEANK